MPMNMTLQQSLMKSKFFIAALAAVLLSGCSPEIYRIYLDVRQPSASGLMLGGKSMAVVYMDGKNAADSIMSASVAEKFASVLDKDYYGGETAVGVYDVPFSDEYTIEDMRSLVMDTGEDVVFLLSSSLGEVQSLGNKPAYIATSVDSAYIFNSSVPVSVSLWAYDSMGKDEVKSYSGNSNIRHSVYNSGIIPEENLKDIALKEIPDGSASKVASLIGSRFTSSWKTESFSFYWFDDWNFEQWEKALDYAEQGKYSKAVDIWSAFVKGKNELKAAHAAYNIAMAFYLMGDMDLAGKWLDMADALGKVTLSSGLRKRIAANLEK